MNVSKTIEQCSQPLPDDTLRAFLEESLSEERSREVLDHVEACLSCETRLDELMRETPAAPPEQPPQLERFEVLSFTPLGEGGSAVVWKMKDCELGRPVAVKVIRREYKNRSRFRREARICSRLTHPGIVPIYDQGELEDGTPYYVMKLVEGETFSCKIRKRENLEENLRIFVAICHAVAYAHQQKVVHRDLKPDNIMIGAHGEVQVMDWGLSKSNAYLSTRRFAGERAAKDDRSTRMGAVMGTCAYMPPEQAEGEVDKIGPRSDIFALGAILCEVLTGRPPFGSENPLDKVARAASLTASKQRLRESNAHPTLIDLANRCLAADMGQRPSRVSEIVDDVAKHHEQVADERHRLQQKQARTRRWLALTAAVLVLALAAGGWQLQRMSEQLRITKLREEAVSHIAKAEASFNDGRKEAMSRHFEAAAESRRKQLLLADETPSRFDLAQTLSRYGHRLLDRSKGTYDPQQALEPLSESCEHRKRLVEQLSERYAYGYAHALAMYGSALIQVGRQEEAADQFQQAMQQLQSQPPSKERKLHLGVIALRQAEAFFITAEGEKAWKWIENAAAYGVSPQNVSRNAGGHSGVGVPGWRWLPGIPEDYESAKPIKPPGEREPRGEQRRGGRGNGSGGGNGTGGGRGDGSGGGRNHF